MALPRNLATAPALRNARRRSFLARAKLLTEKRPAPVTSTAFLTGHDDHHASDPRTVRKPAPKHRTVVLTAAYLPATEGGYTAEILEAVGVHSQGDSFDEARANLHAVVALMLEESPHPFHGKPAATPPGALCEKLFVVLPA